MASDSVKIRCRNLSNLNGENPRTFSTSTAYIFFTTLRGFSRARDYLPVNMEYRLPSYFIKNNVRSTSEGYVAKQEKVVSTVKDKPTVRYFLDLSINVQYKNKINICLRLLWFFKVKTLSLKTCPEYYSLYIISFRMVCFSKLTF